MSTTRRIVHGATMIALFLVVDGAQGCGAPPDAAESSVASAWASDCASSDQAGALVAKARAGTLYDARLSYRQTNDAGQRITAACDLSRHQVTSQGMANVPLHCSGRSQAASGYARVGARWGTSYGAESCTTDFCAAIYVQDASGTLHEAARDIYLKDRFFCSQADDRTDLRLDVDACTYADVIGALKGTSSSADDSNLTFDARGKLAGYAARGLALKYRMYPCAAGPGGNGGACTDVPPAGSSYSCGQQAAWGKCGESWMQGRCDRSCNRCGCDDVAPDARYSCAQQAGWGKCGESWMIDGDYCRHTCGRC